MIMMIQFSWVLYYFQRNRVLMSNDVIWGLIWWGEELIEIIEVGGCARDFRVSIHLLALNRQSLNSQFLSAGREKTSKKPLKRLRSGGWFRLGKVLSTLNDFGIPKEPLT